MANDRETLEAASFHQPCADAAPVPGLLLIYAAGGPVACAIPLVGGALEVGRSTLEGLHLDDSLMSRRHARVTFADGRWAVADLGSRNGTFVDGAAVEGGVAGEALRVVRAGNSLFLLVADLRPARAAAPADDRGLVMGATLRAVWGRIRAAALSGPTLHITGESGAGKELAARAFHDLGPRASGPFVAVNCAAIPEGVAEGLLFGARKGAYSGAVADSEGYVKSAHGGTLFLDEVAELDLAVQAKLLRVLETREVLALGASRPQPVDVRVCSATHRDLRAEVAERRFREDLFFRLGRPHVEIPPLRQRLEEIPEHLDRELRRTSPRLRADVSFVEACLLRRWPGNVRELLVELGEAVRVARERGECVVGKACLSATAGTSFAAPGEEASPAGASSSATSSTTLRARKPMPARAAIEAALEREQGRVAAAARALGLHRTQLRRWLEKNGVDPGRWAPAGTTLPLDEGDDEEEAGGP